MLPGSEEGPRKAPGRAQEADSYVFLRVGDAQEADSYVFLHVGEPQELPRTPRKAPRGPRRPPRTPKDADYTCFHVSERPQDTGHIIFMNN